VTWLIDCSERLVQQALWKGILINSISRQDWQLIKEAELKAFETKTLDLVKRSASGIGKPFYSNMATFLSLHPSASFENCGQLDLLNEQVIKRKWAFIENFLQNLLYGY